MSLQFKSSNRTFTKFAVRFFSLLFAISITLTLCVEASAQSTTDGAIGGTVYDANGAVIPNASVLVRSASTNQEFTALSDTTGHFRVARLQPGTYSLTIKSSSFSDTVIPTVIVEVGLVTERDVTMKVGTSTETVVVSDTAPVVNTEQQDFTTNVNQVSIDNLPVNGRRWSNFALLTPGANPDGGFGLITFRGISGLLNNNTVDGGDNNQAFFSEEKGRTRLSYSIAEASVQEFQVNTSNYSAEYGRSAGGVVNAITKSGTNSIHGSAFYYLRDNNYGATNPSTTIAQVVNGATVITPFKPKDKRHQFGLTVGGPIVKDKLFYFFSYDQQKRNFPGNAIPNNPATFLAPGTAAELAAFSTRTGLTGPAATAAFNNGLNFLTSLTGTVPRTGDQTLFFPKIDWHATDKQIVSLSYNRLRWSSPAGIQTQATNNLGIASFGNDYVHGEDVNAKLTSVITNSVSNELRFKYGRDFEFENSQPPAPGEPRTAINGSAPDVQVGSDFEFGKPTFLERAAFPDERRYQWADSVSLVHGKHQFKFGLDINHVDDLSKNLRNESGSFQYANRLDFISDFTNPNTCSFGALKGPCWQTFQQGFGTLGLEFNTNDYNFFAQDAWHVLQRVSLNLGLRYEYEQLPNAQLGFSAIPQTQTLPSNKTNFGPRVGFAWDVFGDGRTAVRGGYGLYYGRVINSTIYNALINTGNPGGQFQTTLSLNSKSSASDVNSAPRYPFVLSGLGSALSPVSVQFFDPNFRNPRIQQADLVVEREVLANTVVSASYLLSLGDFLPNFIDTNLPAASGTTTYLVNGGPLNGQTFTAPFYGGARPITKIGNLPLGQITYITSNISSRYDALVLQANRRLKDGIQFQANYTWSHALDFGQHSTTFTSGMTVLDPANLGLEYGSSDFDYRHRFVLSAVYQPSFKIENSILSHIVNGFTLAPIYQASSGRPLTGNVIGNVPGGVSGDLLGTGISFGNHAFFERRNAFPFPRTQIVDMRLSRTFKLYENLNLELLAEGFNLFNHRNVTSVQATEYSLVRNVGAGTAASPYQLNYNPNTPGFGTPFSNGYNTNTIFRERQVQFGARVNF